MLTPAAEYDAWLIKIGDGGTGLWSGYALPPSGPTGQASCRQPAKLIVAAHADPRLRVRRDPAIPCREVWCFLTDRHRCARRMPFAAVLANGQRALPGRWIRPLRRLRPDENLICHRPVRNGGEATTRRARPPSRGKRLHVILSVRGSYPAPHAHSRRRASPLALLLLRLSR
jgi:hypothetical protein